MFFYLQETLTIVAEQALCKIQIVDSSRTLQTVTIDPTTNNLFYGDDSGYITRVRSKNLELTWNGTLFTSFNHTMSTFSNGFAYFLSSNNTLLEIDVVNLNLTRTLLLNYNEEYACIGSIETDVFAVTIYGGMIIIDVNTFAIKKSPLVAGSVQSCYIDSSRNLLVLGTYCYFSFISTKWNI